MAQKLSDHFKKDPKGVCVHKTGGKNCAYSKLTCVFQVPKPGQTEGIMKCKHK